MTVTNDWGYYFPLRPKVTIKTLDGSDILYTFNAFNETNPLVITGIDTENAVNETGTFNITIDDSNNQIPKDNIRAVKVYLEMGKTLDTFQTFLIGHGKIFRVDRPATNYQQYNIAGFGSMRQFSRLFLHRREASKIQDEDKPRVINDPEFHIDKLFYKALTKRLWRPLKDKDKSLEDLTGITIFQDETGISPKVNLTYPVVNIPMTRAWDFFDQLCAVSGANWFIDYSQGFENFIVSYTPDLHTGIIIKSGDLKDGSVDDANTTSYIKSSFSVEDAATAESVTATRLITTTIADKQLMVSQKTGGGSTSLTYRAIAQQVIIENDARRIDTIAMKLAKVGEPDSPKSRVNGDIVLDNGSNKPSNEVLDTFSVDLGSINTDPDWIEVNDMDVSARKLEGGTRKIWIRLFQRSGNDDTATAQGFHVGDPNHDDTNTIKWTHNNTFASTQALYSATASVGDAGDKESLTWNTTNQGPMYTFKEYSNIRRMQARTNEAAVDAIGLEEEFIESGFLLDPNMVNQYLSINLAQMSKPRRTISEYKVTVPNNFLFRPYQWVTFIDGLSEIEQDLQVKRAHYIISSQAKGEDAQLGTLHCDITLGGLYYPLLGSCSCE